jgi:vacuolar-type H+-ATPase subunit C/Vma6
MNRVSRYAFIHAKIHGIMAKSYVDDRIRTLLRYTNLLELSRELFPSQQISVGEHDLIRDVQLKFEKKTISALVRIVSFFPEPPPLLVHVLREYDFRNLKTLFRGRFTGIVDLPLWDIGPYGEVPLDREGFPENLKNTRFEDLLEGSGEKDMFHREFELDKRYFAELAAVVRRLPSRERRIVEPLVSLEITLQNLVWAMRLRNYFNLPWEEAEKLLFPTGYAEIPGLAQNLYELPFDDPAPWEKTKYGRLLGSFRDGRIDPEGAEGAAMKYLYLRTRRLFYGNPFTLSAVYAFFRIKRYESMLVKSVSEGVRMNIPPARLAEMIGAS